MATTVGHSELFVSGIVGDTIAGQPKNELHLLLVPVSPHWSFVGEILIWWVKSPLFLCDTSSKPTLKLHEIQMKSEICRKKPTKS